MAHSVLAVANEFLLRAEGGDKPLTAMQLQKLCYLAHGFTLAFLNRPLTSDVIEAWDYGPVFPALYDAVKRYGPSPITQPISRNNWAVLDHIKGGIVRESMDKPERRILETVWNDYGQFDAFKLSALTHQGDSPWAKIYRPGPRNLAIPDDMIKEYFLDLTRQPAA